MSGLCVSVSTTHTSTYARYGDEDEFFSRMRETFGVGDNCLGSAKCGKPFSPYNPTAYRAVGVALGGQRNWKESRLAKGWTAAEPSSGFTTS